MALLSTMSAPATSENPARNAPDLRRRPRNYRYLGGSPANIAVCVSKLGGRSAVISKTGIGAFVAFPESELHRLIVANCCLNPSIHLAHLGYGSI